MCILLNVKKHEKTFALNVDIFNMIGVSKVSLKSSTKNAKIKTASVFGVDIKPERIESVKDDITLDRLFEIQGEKIDKRS